MMWILYDLLLILVLVCYVPGALWRKRLPHWGWTMRLGQYPESIASRFRGGAIWIHAVSVGEVMAVRPLLRALRTDYPGTPLVLSTVTPGGFQTASRMLADEDGVVIYAPLDLSVAVRRALAAIRPRMLLLVESELWPNLIRLAKHQRIPVAVVNGRISERACRRYRRVQRWLGWMMNAVDLFLMQSETDAVRITSLGAPVARVKVMGNLKWDASLLARPDARRVQGLFGRLGLQRDHPLLVAGSTHRGEEEIILEAFKRLRNTFKHIRLVIAPRHLERVREVEQLLHRSGMVVGLASMEAELQVERASLMAATVKSWDMIVLDTLGELPMYYGVATIVIIGGSFIPHGGQNPLEAAVLGKPIVFGPFMHNFADITSQLVAARGARQLENGFELPYVLDDMVMEPAEALAMGRRALALVERFSGTSRKTVDALKSLLS